MHLNAAFLPLTGLQRKLTNRPFIIWIFGQLPRLSFTFRILFSSIGTACMLSTVCTVCRTARLHGCCSLCSELHFPPSVAGRSVPLSFPAPPLPLPTLVPSSLWGSLACQPCLCPFHVLDSWLPDSTTYVFLPDYSTKHTVNAQY